LYVQCRARGGADWQAFLAWRYSAGAALETHARFEALDVAYPTGDWRSWPLPFQHPVSEAVSAFEAGHPDAVASHGFAQWLAEEGLADAQRRARAAGMTIGLIADLAVGVDPRGSDGWQEPDAFLHAVSIGAPPDLLAPQGQSWGLTTFAPNALRQSGYGPFLAMVRSALRHAGGLRIDHILGMQRLWLVPEGGDASAGSYVSYPRDDLLGLLSLEAHLGDRVLIGEDLGTVPHGFRERLSDNGILGMSVLMFERDGEQYRPVTRWRDDAVGLTTTHDLPTLAGWWIGRDIEWRRELELIDDATRERQFEERGRDRAAMIARLTTDHSLPAYDGEGSAETFVDAAIAQVAATPSPLVLIPIEDLTATVEQPNLPGTTSGHPNWRRRFIDDVDSLFERPDVRRRFDLLGSRRRP
jgi:4-alpha-glucanotransferase